MKYADDKEEQEEESYAKGGFNDHDCIHSFVMC